MRISRRRELDGLVRKQKRDADRAEIPVTPRIRVDNSADRPGLEASVAAYRGPVHKEITCSCGHVGAVRIALGARVRCSKCGKAA